MSVIPVPSSPRVTVVVPTCGRESSLTRLLSGLAHQRGPDVAWDVVVVDNAGSAGTQAVVAARARSFPVPLSIVREKRSGTSFARNRGIAAARGDVIAFLDDDVVPDPDWLGRLIAPIVEGRCKGVGGRVVLDPSVLRPKWFIQEWMGGYLSDLDLGRQERELGPDEWVLTANAAFAVAALRAVGGFDTALGPKGRNPLVNDDVDLCRRVMAQVGAIRYVPDAAVVHDLPAARLRRRYLFRRMYAQGRYDWMLDRDAVGDSFLDGFRELAWPRIAYVGRLLRYERALSRAVPLRAICELARAAGMLVEAARAARAQRHARQEEGVKRANTG